MPADVGVSPAMDPERLEAWRNERAYRTPTRRLRTDEDARRFVDDVGIAYLYGDRTVEMPTLWGAVVGSRRPVPHSNRDPDVGRVWDWKDTLPIRGLFHYGKLLRDKPTLVSLALLPSFYALSPNYGDPLDYIEQYEAGLLSVEARRVYEALLDGGAMATSRLRTEAGLAGGGAVARRFDGAITELQVQLKIARVGISDASRWGYAFVYDLFARAHPNVPEVARGITTDRAMETILLKHLYNVGIERDATLVRLFRWEPWEWERLLDRLTARGEVVRQTNVSGLAGRCVAHTAALDALMGEHGE